MKSLSALFDGSRVVRFIYSVYNSISHSFQRRGGLAISIVFSMLLSNGSAAQTTEVFEEWVKETAEQGLHQQGFTAIDAAANVYLTGSTLNSSGNYDILLTKTDRKGNELWSITFDGPGGGEDAATNVVLDNSGFVYVCGTVFVSTAAGNNYFLAKLDSSGNEIWRFDYDNNGNHDVAADLVVDGSGLIYVTGGSYNPITQLVDFWTIKVSAQGSMLWSNVHDHSGMLDFGAKIRLNGSRVFVAGVAQTAVNQFAVKTLSHNLLNGSVIGTHLGAASTAQISEVRDVFIDSAENIYIVGSAMSQANGRDAYLIKLSENLNLMWQVTYDGNGLDDSFNSVSVTASGAVYVCGTEGVSTGVSDGLVARYDGLGALVWQHTEGHTTEAHNSLNAIAVNSAGKCIVTGSANTLGGETLRTLALSATGSVLWRANYHNPQHNKRAIGRTVLFTESGDAIVSGQIETSPDKFTYITLKYIERSSFLDSTLPLSSTNGRGFVKNYGQIKTSSGAAADHVKYASIDAQALLFFSEEALHAVYSTNHQDSLVNDTVVRLDLQFVNPHRDLVLLAATEKKLYYNYYIGESERYERVKNFESLHYFKVWRGIDLVYPNSASGELCLFIDQPGNAADIVFKTQADSMVVDSTGALRLFHPLGAYYLPPLTAFQRFTNGYAETSWQPTWSILTDSTFSIAGVGSYSTINGPLAIIGGATELCIEGEVPQEDLLEYGSYFGSSSDDRISDAVAIGNAYFVGGWTSAAELDLPDDFDGDLWQGLPTNTDSRGYIAKFDLGEDIPWISFITGASGNNSGEVYIRALDSRRVGSGIAYDVVSACGTAWANLQTQGPQVNNSNPSQSKAFVLEVRADTGILEWLTSFDSSSADHAYDLKSNGSNLVVIGATSNINSNFPVLSGPSGSHLQNTGSFSGFIAEFNPNRSLVWSTLFNGSGTDEMHCLDINSQDHIIVAGTTTSTDLYNQLVPGTYQDFTLDGSKNAFLVEFGPQREYLWSTLWNGEIAGDAFHKTVAWLHNDKIVYGGTCIDVADIELENPGSGYFLGQGALSTTNIHPYLSVFNSARQVTWCTLLDEGTTGSFNSTGVSYVKVKDDMIICGFTTKASNLLLQEVSGVFFHDQLDGWWPNLGYPTSDVCLTAFNGNSYALLHATLAGGMEIDKKVLRGIDFLDNGDMVLAGTTRSNYLCNNGTIERQGIKLKDSGEHWQFNVSQPSNTNVTFTPSFSGWIYRLNIDDVVALSDDSHPSIKEYINVYPNPAQDRINVVSDQIIERILIYNYMGHLVLDRNGIAQSRCEISIEHLTSGTYLVVVENNNSTSVTPLIRIR